MRAPAASHVPKAVAILGTGSVVLLLVSCLGELCRIAAKVPYDEFNWGLRVPHGHHAPTLWATEMAASSRQAIAILMVVVLLDTAGPIRFGMIWNIVPLGLAMAGAISAYAPTPSLANGAVQVVGMAVLVWALVMDSFLEGKCCPCRCTPGSCGPNSGEASQDDSLEELRTRLRDLDVASAVSSGTVRLAMSRTVVDR